MQDNIPISHQYNIHTIHTNNSIQKVYIDVF